MRCKFGVEIMSDPKGKANIKKIDTKEFELPDTLFVRDVENQVFQGIIFQCLSKIEGIGLVEGNFIDHILGRTTIENLKGISIEQDNKNHSIGIRIEVNICYGYSIPEMAEEIQSLCAEEVTKLTGLHVSYVHVIFKNIILLDQVKKGQLMQGSSPSSTALLGTNIEEEYNDEF